MLLTFTTYPFIVVVNIFFVYVSSMHVVFSTPILVFALGIVASLICSDLAIPDDISKFMSFYLLFLSAF